MANSKVVKNGEGKHYKPSPTEDIYFLVTGDDTDGAFDHFDIRVGHLDGFPLHIHLKQHETFHVIEGELRLQVGEDMIDAKAGDFIFIPMGVKHTYVNLKQEPARAVGILMPGGFQKFVEEMIQARPSPDSLPDRATLDTISAKYHQKQVGPPLAVSLGLKKAPGH
jgi:mannose-6-phosphate isomerase-like protein (cupin superfamily)